MERKRRNILFLMTDEHRFDVSGFMGNSVIRTPNLDKLAKDAVVFDNAYTPSPVCVPARQCMMAGQLPRSCNCEGWIDLAPGYLTFSRRFAQYGYMTTACGKLHHQGKDMMQGWLHRIGNEMLQEPWAVDGAKKEEIEKYTKASKNWKWSDAKEICRAGIAKGPYVTMDQYTLEGAKNFIEDYFNSPWYDREQPQRPLMLKVSFIQPHYPYAAQEDKFNYYLNRVKQYENQEVFPHEFLSTRAVNIGTDVSQREAQRALAAYYSMVETVDQYFGEVLEKLRQVGQDPDDWIIVYTSDHGDMLGEHGIWEKQKFFEGSVRVPLFIRLPGEFSGSRVSENVSLCDLYATLCDLCDIPIPDGLDSRTLTGLMAGNCQRWDNEVVSEFAYAEVRNFMIKQDCLKYQWYNHGPEVLFDLERDPGEVENRINDPVYREVVEKFRQRLDELS